MRAEAERQDTRKAMAYDILQILRENPEKERYTRDLVKFCVNTSNFGTSERIYTKIYAVSYTPAEIEKILHVYLTTADQK